MLAQVAHAGPRFLIIALSRRGGTALGGTAAADRDLAELGGRRGCTWPGRGCMATDRDLAELGGAAADWDLAELGGTAADRVAAAASVAAAALSQRARRGAHS